MPGYSTTTGGGGKNLKKPVEFWILFKTQCYVGFLQPMFFIRYEGYIMFEVDKDSATYFASDMT